MSHRFWLELVKRILRYKNYMLALVHKNILPLEHRVPFLGDVIFFSEGLKFNIEWILFGTYLTNPWAPFSSFQLKRKSLPLTLVGKSWKTHPQIPQNFSILGHELDRFLENSSIFGCPGVLWISFFDFSLNALFWNALFWMSFPKIGLTHAPKICQ